MKTLIALLVAAFLVACGSDRVAGGNGTSTDNVVTARKLRIDSILALLPPGDTAPYPMLVQIDSNTIAFDSAHPDGRDLRIYRDSTPLAFQLREWNSIDRRASVWVRIASNDRGDTNKRITLRIGRDSTVSRSNAAATWLGVSDSVRQKTSSVLLSRFDTDSLLVGTPCKCNWWYVGKSPYAYVNPKSGLDSAGRGRPGKAFHLSYSNASAPNWALMGTRLGFGTHRFAGLDSITFWARGNGILKVALEDYRDLYNISKAWQTVSNLSYNTWTRYKVRPAEFDPPDPYNLGWFWVNNRINTFTVFGQEGTDFWITDIRIHGISPAEVP